MTPACRAPTFFGDWSRQFLQPEGLLLVALPPKEKGAMWTIEDVEVVNMKFHSYVLAFAQDEDNGAVRADIRTTRLPHGVSTRFHKIVPDGLSAAHGNCPASLAGLVALSCV